MKYYERKTGEILEEIEYGKKKLEFLYHTTLGRMLLKLISLPFFSNLVRLYKNSVFSKKSIPAFIQKYSVEYPGKDLSSYRSFNEFFIRKRDVVFDDEKTSFIAIADSKLSVFPIDVQLRLGVKHSTYSVAELLDDERMANRFSNGCCLVFRLSVDDVHRYFYFDDGEVLYRKKIKGQLHTIRPISERYRVFAMNKREVTLMNTKHFGMAAQIEVGALLVGRIVNHSKLVFKRGDEKGYFEFGGSTIILLLEHPPKMDADIMKFNDAGIEVRVLAGERIGELC